MPNPHLHQLHIPLRIDTHVTQRIAHQQMLDARQDSRKGKRYSIEISKRVIVEFERSDGRVSADAIVRDMSEDGVALWIGTYIHSQTPCWILLMSDHGPEFEIEGEVRWCRHFAHSVHEIGLHVTKKNANVLSETLSEQSNKLASDLADMASMIRLLIQRIGPHLDLGLTPEFTQDVYRELSSLVGE